jgi:histidine triad (HIT) family protein
VTEKATAPCLFCSIAAGDVPAAIVGRGTGWVAFLDRAPVFLGHVLVVPDVHTATVLDLGDDQLVPLFAATRTIARAVVGGLGAQGSFVAINNVVSQSVPHLHVHVVPRTKGDGLRGFFWPRKKYGSDAEMEDFRARIAAAIPPGAS